MDRADYVVLDEADRMLDKGFENDIRRIMSGVKSERQTMMCEFFFSWIQSDRADGAMDSQCDVARGSASVGEHAAARCRAGNGGQRGSESEQTGGTSCGGARRWTMERVSPCLCCLNPQVDLLKAKGC